MLRGSTVFILDSDPEITRIYHELLSSDCNLFSHGSIAEFESALVKQPHADLLVTETEFEDGGLNEISVAATSWLEKTPVLIVSRTAEIDVVFCLLKTWANDFITKPINNQYFVAKCQQLLARSGLFQCDALSMRLFRKSRNSLPLTANEFRLMTFLSLQDEFSSPLEEAIDEVWGQKVPHQRLHTLLSRLRPKLTDLQLEIEVSKTGHICVFPNSADERA